MKSKIAIVTLLLASAVLQIANAQTIDEARNVATEFANSRYCGKSPDPLVITFADEWAPSMAAQRDPLMPGAESPELDPIVVVTDLRLRGIRKQNAGWVATFEYRRLATSYGLGLTPDVFRTLIPDPAETDTFDLNIAATSGELKVITPPLARVHWFALRNLLEDEYRQLKHSAVSTIKPSSGRPNALTILEWQIQTLKRVGLALNERLPPECVE